MSKGWKAQAMLGLASTKPSNVSQKPSTHPSLFGMSLVCESLHTLLLMEHVWLLPRPCSDDQHVALELQGSRSTYRTVLPAKPSGSPDHSGSGL